MKFTVERIALERMVEQLKIERGVTGQSQRMMRARSYFVTGL